jgi:hypothetical protein
MKISRSRDWLCVSLLGLLATPLWAAGPAAQAPAPASTTLLCEAVYLPARSVWSRRVEIGHDQRRVRSVQIDGVPVHTFTIAGTVILTALDNERIQIDTAGLTWSSDFRGLATAQGRCERVSTAG